MPQPDTLGIVRGLEARRLFARPLPPLTATDVIRAELNVANRKCTTLEAENARLRLEIEMLQARSVPSVADMPISLSECPTVKELVQLAAVVTGVRAEIMVGPSRPRPHAWPRHFAVWLIRECRWDMSLPQIARLFGNRDHTTIMHALKNVEKNRDRSPFNGWISDPRIQGLLAALKEKSAGTSQSGGA